MPDDKGGTTVAVVYTTTPVDLFRAGNAGGPRLDKLRLGKDTFVREIFFASGEKKIMVIPAGGLSLYDAKDPEMEGPWWIIPAGVALPETLRLIPDRRKWSPALGTHLQHYSLRPARMMTVEEYANGLTDLAKQALREAKVINEAQEQPGNVTRGGRK